MLLNKYQSENFSHAEMMSHGKKRKENLIHREFMTVPEIGHFVLNLNKRRNTVLIVSHSTKESSSRSEL